MGKVEITIDSKKHTVSGSGNVLQAALDAGLRIAHFCYHKKLSIEAGCRMCLVDVEGAARPVLACTTPVAANMVVRTDTHRVVQAQKAVLEFLLINHPLDCPVCDKAGECTLQDISVDYGEGRSRYEEEKRTVSPKEAGPLILMQEMTRCIHCTRCIRFEREVAGTYELGVFNRSGHFEIAPLADGGLTGELSGNMIDLCPVGAITSRPFRFRARSWELATYKSISPHDSLGSNLLVQTMNNRVCRVLPAENEAINECWISDRDRFSCESLDGEERLTVPMVRQDGKWIRTDWATALEYVAHGLKDISETDGAQAIAGISSPWTTTEEMFLLKKLLNGLGSSSVDFRPARSNFTSDSKVVPWLGMQIEQIDALDSAFIIGSSLRNDHPVLAIRFRRLANRGVPVSRIHAKDEDWLMPVKHTLLGPPSKFGELLAQVLVCVSRILARDLPEDFAAVRATSEEAEHIAKILCSQGRHAIFLGAMAENHPDSAALHTMAEWLSVNTGATLGYLTCGANTVGGHLVSLTRLPSASLENVPNDAHSACLLLHAEPRRDAANPQSVLGALFNAKMVVVMSPFIHGTDYADVLLPVSAFTETSGTFINCEGRVQSFQGAASPPGQTRPAWKVLRVLGNLLGMEGFEYENTKEVLADFIEEIGGDPAARLNNFSLLPPAFSPSAFEGLERLPVVDALQSDSMVRRAPSLQKMYLSRANRLFVPPSFLRERQITERTRVVVELEQGSMTVEVMSDAALADNVAELHLGEDLDDVALPLFCTLEVRLP